MQRWRAGKGERDRNLAKTARPRIADFPDHLDESIVRTMGKARKGGDQVAVASIQLGTVVDDCRIPPSTAREEPEAGYAAAIRAA